MKKCKDTCNTWKENFKKAEENTVNRRELDQLRSELSAQSQIVKPVQNNTVKDSQISLAALTQGTVHLSKSDGKESSCENQAPKSNKQRNSLILCEPVTVPTEVEKDFRPQCDESQDQKNLQQCTY